MRDGSRERDGRADGRSEAERGIEREGEQEVARHLRPFHEISADPPASLSLSLSAGPESSVNLFDVVCVPFAKRGIVESAVG